MTVSLHWFRRDLRLHDNPALSAARAASDRVYGVYCLSDLDAFNPRQRSFAIGCLKQLRLSLERRDATLSLLSGVAASALAEAARRLDASAIYVARAYSAPERETITAATEALARERIELRLSRGHAV